jgi:signal transduction histidine kinase
MDSLRSRLYLRIWLAVVAAVAVLSLLLGWAWRLTRDERGPPPRELVLRNEAGEVIGQGRSEGPWRPGALRQIEVLTRDGQRLSVEFSRPPHPTHAAGGMRAPGGPWPLGFLSMVGLVALAVALGAYPIIRRLTKRLEKLQQGVERWGAGDLSARVTVEGTDEVAFLAERFNHAAERIEKLLASHKALLANASHELRSPLARIRMGLELIGEGSDAQRLEIRRSLQELDQLIDEILLASRLDTAEATREPREAVDLTGLAAEECARVGADLVLEPSAGDAAVVLQAWPRLLRRLLRNLLENAQRHGAGELSLTLARVGQEAEVRVNDRGPGVPPAQRQRIFEPFYRLPGASEREGGVGLGLALVKRIAELHGGRVHCEDRPGGGASFVLRLPLR